VAVRVPLHEPLDPPLVGRDDALAAATRAVEGRPGLLLIVGEAGAGTTRLAQEIALRISRRGVVLVNGDLRDGDPMSRLAGGLEAAGLGSDPERAAALRPWVALLGDLGDPDDARALAALLGGGRSLALVCARDAPADVASVTVRALPPDAAEQLALLAAAELDPALAARVAELGDGLPRCVVSLARAAGEWAGGDEPLPMPRDMLDLVAERTEGLDPTALDVVRWAATLDEPVETNAVVRVSGASETWVEARLDALTEAGVLAELTGPGRPRWRFRHRLTRAGLLAGLSGGERRRRHAGALAAGRAAGRPAAELVRHAVGAADPAAVVTLGARAAKAMREHGDAEAALEHADRALAWWEPDVGEPPRLAALAERGLALSELARWAAAAEALDAAAQVHRAAGEAAAALGCASAAGAARWILGQREEALRNLAEHLEADDASAGPAPERADALALAAGMATMTARYTEGVGLAHRARAEAQAADARETAARALHFLGLAESGREGDRSGLALLERAEAEASGTRTATLAVIARSHVLLALGLPDAAAQAARSGMARAHELGLADHALVLRGNLGEALAALGRLSEAREHLEAAARGWAGLEPGPLSPADPGLAWLLLAEGRIPEALQRYHALTGLVSQDQTLFEQLAPLATGHAATALAAGEATEAAAVARAALSSWRSTDDRLVVVPLLAVGAEAGEPEEAAAWRAELGAAGTSASPARTAFRLLADGHLAARASDEDAAGEAYRAAAEAFAGTGMAWWAARARLLAGGRDDVVEARTAFADMGAGGWRQRAEAALRSMGVRAPSRGANPAAATGGISAREMEVLEQLALGLSSREIGEALFISDRTVGRHLSHLFRKLGVNNRTAALRVARERGLLESEGRVRTP
jgi:DNA-binding CsgD family transcriptional regulator/tetratricopeptide (TPR) repeat protein